MATNKKTNSKSASGITRVGGAATLAMPDYLTAHAGEGLEALEQHVVLPRLKIIQSSGSSDLKEKYGVGTCILDPGSAIICPENGSFKAVLVFSWTDYNTWYDISDRAHPFPIKESTLDSKSDLARKCSVFETMEEVYPDNPKMSLRHSTHINFIAFIHDEEHPLHRQPFVLAFYRGEFTNGAGLAQFLRMRKAAIWGSIIEFTPTERHKNDNDWFGVDYGNPEDGDAFIKADEVEFFRESHAEMVKMHEAKRLGVSFSAESRGGSSSDGEEEDGEGDGVVDEDDTF